MDPTDPTDPTTGPRPRVSSVRYRIFVVVALLVAAAALTAGVVATQTDDDPPVAVSGRPDVVEHVIPRDGAAIQRQAEIGIDLAPGYEGTLVLYGQEIPEPQLRVVPEQNQVFFTAAEGKVVEELAAGRTCVTAVAWRSQLGRGVDDQHITWCFEVT